MSSVCIYTVSYISKGQNIMAQLDNICGKISRVIFVIINLLLGVVGIAAIALGSYIVHIARLQGGLGVLLGCGAILIVVGVIVILVISAGLYGAVALSKIMLGIYIFCVTIIIILEIVGAILGFVFRGKVVTYAGNIYINGIEDYRAMNDSRYNKHINNMIDYLQEKGKCCGWNDTDGNWQRSPYYTTTRQFPQSCECKLGQSTCVNSSITASQSIWNVTCENSATSLLRKNLGIIGGVAAGIAVIEICPLVLAILLVVLIKNEYKTV